MLPNNTILLVTFTLNLIPCWLIFINWNCTNLLNLRCKILKYRHWFIGKNHIQQISHEKWVKHDSETNEKINNKVAPHWLQMGDDSLATATIEKIDWINSLVGWLYWWVETYLNTHGNKTRKEWTNGDNSTKMNEKGNNASWPLKYERGVNYFHMDVKEKNHHELNGVFKKNKNLM